jgi:hypothetical protein
MCDPQHGCSLLCHVCLLHRDLRSQQYHPWLGVCHLLPDKGKEGMLTRHRQLHSGSFFYLDTVHVAFVRRASLHNGHVFQCGVECSDCHWSLGHEILADKGQQEDQTVRERDHSVLRLLEYELTVG